MKRNKQVPMEQTIASPVDQLQPTSTTWSQWGKAAFAFTVATGAYALAKIVGGDWGDEHASHGRTTNQANLSLALVTPAVRYPTDATYPTDVRLSERGGHGEFYDSPLLTFSALALSTSRYSLMTLSALGLSFMQHFPRVEAVFPATLDLGNLTNSEGFTLQGAAANDNTGISVSAAGDVNGDGLADMLVGANLADPMGRTDAGVAYLLFGTNGSWPAVVDLGNLTSSQGVVLQGAMANDNTGISVSSAGDINGDRLDDVLVGASGADPLGRTGAGVVYLLFGRTGSWPAVIDLASFNASLGVVLQGAAGAAGHSVSHAGDVNGDGLDDVLVGAYGVGPSNTGVVYLLFGNNGSWPVALDLGNLTSVQGVVVVLQGAAASDQTGYSVSAAGDVNGDGLADVLVGAYGASPLGRSSVGVAYLLFGMNGSWPAVVDLGNLIPSQGVVLQGAASISFDSTGWSVSTAGDINGDGLADVLVGADEASPLGRNAAGVAYLLFGMNGTWPVALDLGNLTSAQGVVLQGAAASDYTGYSVSTAGDVNGDGLADMLVGAHVASPFGRTDVGAAYLLFGTYGSWPAVLDLGSLTSSQGVVLQGGSRFDRTGGSVSCAGDVNGDGLMDMLVGAREVNNLGRTDAGVAYLIFSQREDPLTLPNTPTTPAVSSMPSATPSTSASNPPSVNPTPSSLMVTPTPSNAIPSSLSSLSPSTISSEVQSPPTQMITLPMTLDSSSLGVSLSEMEPVDSEANSSNSTTIIIAGIVSVAVLTGIVITAVCIGKKRKQHQEDSSSESESPIPTKPDSDEIEFLDVGATPTANENYTIPANQLEYGKELGGGAFGTVYKGTWLHNEVAIKQLKDQSLSGKAYAEFQHEVKIMAQLRNPRVVHFYGACFEKNNYAIVMEYLPKGSLYQYLHSDKAIAWPQRVQLGKDVGTGLTYLHNQHILHRDLKSLNVLLHKHKKILRAKLTDFGLSKIKTHSQLTVNEGSKGTLPWMAPELVVAKPHYSQASDVYSYGMVLWELSTRAIPFEDAHPSVIPNLVSKGERPDIPKGTPKGIVKLIKQSWAQEPKKRPSAHDVVSELDTIEVPSEHNTENKQKRDKKTDSTTSSSGSFGGSANFFKSDTMDSNTYQGNLVTGQGMTSTTQSALTQTGIIQDNLHTLTS